MEIESLLKQSLGSLELSRESEARIIGNCILQCNQKEMFAEKGSRLLRRSVSAAVAVALCLCLSVTAAAAGYGGHFKDVKNWCGAVTGTKYEQATEEIQISANAAHGKLVVLATMLTPNKFPYRELEEMGIESYQIVDKTGAIVQKGKATDFYKMSEATVEMEIPLDGLGSGEYQLHISTLIGGNKPEQPLPISGDWKCGFTISAE